MRCNPLLPWHLQRTSQPGASRFCLFTQQCFAGYEGPISGITLAGLAGLPNEFLDFILLCSSGEPIGRDNAALIQRSIIAKTKSCEFCYLSALQVQLDYVSMHQHKHTRPKVQSERAWRLKAKLIQSRGVCVLVVAFHRLFRCACRLYKFDVPKFSVDNVVRALLDKEYSVRHVGHV